MIITPQQLTYLRDAIFAVVGLVLIFGISYLVYHSGQRSIEMSDAQTVVKQTLHDDEVITRATLAAQTAVAQFKVQLAAPPAADAPHIRLCQPTRSAGVPALSGTGPGAHDPSATPAVAAGPDIGPEFDKRLADSDAKVRALQAYITGCITAGRCGAVNHAQ